mmetsp:Transcript_37508/g.98375  ORF Transcript_37508/g.98375 Transcript_37508/m.98375 type:complete len:337 (+) Transcript_37508:78-1088(+)
MEPPASKRARADDALSSSEATQYDRQIRLWGVDAQKRLRSARLAVIGASGLAAEICKNLVLAGIGELTLIDAGTVDATDLPSNFFFNHADIGRPRAETMVPGLQTLNPNVEIRADVAAAAGKPPPFWGSEHFDLVIATDIPLHAMAEINASCRAGGASFFGAAVDGFVGMSFADLGTHDYIAERTIPPKDKGKEPEVVKEECTAEFVPLAAALAQSWAGVKVTRHQSKLFFRYLVASAFEREHGRRAVGEADMAALTEARAAALAAVGADVALVPDGTLAAMCRDSCQLGPVCAIVGGIVAAEVIKAISQKDQPYNNFLFYDGVATAGQVMQIGST